MTDHLTSKQHDLKCWPEFFDAVADGSKPFEIRENDRDYKVGDTLRLREWDWKTEQYTGREVTKGVTFLTAWAQRDNHVVMGLASVPPVDRLDPHQAIRTYAERVRKALTNEKYLRVQQQEMIELLCILEDCLPEWAIEASVTKDARPCTCHPDDNPPTPCPQKYALSECRAAVEKGDVCETCDKPLPPLAQWSMPSCPECVEKAERAVETNERRIVEKGSPEHMTLLAGETVESRPDVGIVETCDKCATRSDFVSVGGFFRLLGWSCKNCGHYNIRDAVSENARL